VRFPWAKGLSTKVIHKEKFHLCGLKYLSRKAVHIWVENFSQGRLKVADDSRPGRPAEIATEATVQRVEEPIRAYRRIAIDSVATYLFFMNGFLICTSCKMLLGLSDRGGEVDCCYHGRGE
jgi:hypothetical protein